MGDQFFPQTINLANSAVQEIETSLVNPRVVLDANGLRAYDANGNVILNLISGQTPAFEGVIDAQGVTLPVYRTTVSILDPPPDGNVLQWTNPVNNEQTAYVSAEQLFAGPNYQSIAALAALLPDASGTRATAKLTAGIPTNTDEAAIKADFFQPGGTITALLTAIAAAQSLTILDNNGNSNFLQLPTSEKLAIAVGQANINFGGTNSGNVLVGHGLGRNPIVAFASSIQGAIGDNVSFSPGNFTATQMTIYGYSQTPPGGPFEIGWVAIG